MRIGVISIQHESNTFLSTPTTEEDFRRVVLAEGDEMLRHYADAHHEVGGFFEGVHRADFTAIPIFAAWAMPSGVVTGETYAYLLKRLMAALEKAGKLDGVLVAPHGAGVSADERDMDGHWLSRVREYVGPDVPIVCTIDPHANLSQRMVDACDAIVAYRTNPHLDQRQRGLEAADILCRTLRGEIRPTIAAAFPAVSIDLASQFTEALPSSALIALADAQLRERPSVISNSILLGFPYADVAEMGTSFIVVTDNDPAGARSLADELADYLVQHRNDFVSHLPNVEEAIEQAVRLEGPVCLLDVGDNVGGGSPGDGTLLATALHRMGLAKSFVCLYDPESAKTAAAAMGDAVDLHMGGKTDDRHGAPLATRVWVRGVYEGRFTEHEPRHGGKTEYDMGLTAVVQTSSRLTVMLTSRRIPPFSLNQLLSCGIVPSEYQIIVAKGVNAPVAAYRPACRNFIRVNTPGVTTNDMRLLGHVHRRRPMFPFEEIR